MSQTEVKGLREIEYKQMRRESKLTTHIIRDRYLLLMLIPGLIYFLIFKYMPMYGILIAFKKYSIFKGIAGSPWVGFRYFIEFFQGPDAFKLIKNTLLISCYRLFFGFPAPILLALAFNELRGKYFKSFSQTVSFLPHFISSVVIVGLVVNFLSPETGIINTLLSKVFGMQPISFMTEPGYFRTIFTTMQIWKEIGWSSIIYLAALSGVNTELYEAAAMDGASRLRQTWHVSLPGLLPTIVILLILTIGNLMDVGASTIILMYNPAIYDTADVLSTYVYRRGLIGADYSFGAAVDLFNSMIGIILIIGANRFSRKLTDTSLW
jgi:putative aldouronate transport system permease protein